MDFINKPIAFSTPDEVVGTAGRKLHAATKRAKIRVEELKTFDRDKLFNYAMFAIGNEEYLRAALEHAREIIKQKEDELKQAKDKIARLQAPPK